MKLSSDNKKALDAIREKIVAKSTQYSVDEMIKLNAVFSEVLSFTGNKPRKVDLSCSSCIMEAVKIVYNYVTYHEPATPVHRPTIVREVKPGDKRLATTFDAKETTLTNLETGEVVKRENIADKVMREHGYDVSDLADHVDGPFTKETPTWDKGINESATTPPPVKKTRRPRTTKPKTK